MDMLTLTKPKMCIYMCGRSNPSTERPLSFYCPAVYCIFLMETTFVQCGDVYGLQNLQKVRFYCFTISDLVISVCNSHSATLHLIDDTCRFSEQFMFCCDLTSLCTEVMISAGGEYLPNPNTLLFRNI